jgi:RHS repeat-associated protein
VLTQESYSFDPVGNMSSKSVDGLVTSYGYDNADQLVLESRSGYAATYSYDGNGNRLAKILNGVTEAYTYDDGDKMLTAGTKSYAYDLAGRTQSVTSPSGTTTCSYDDEDRLTSIFGPGVNQQYTYNGLDARRSKISGGVTVNTYKRAGVSPTAPVINDGQATYTPGISERRSGASKFFHSDYLGSNKTLTNSSQTVTDTRQFDAFGLQTGSTGSSPTPFGFAGGWGYQSDGTGLQLLGHRYYDPSTGRFLTRDPIGDGRNWYGYCENNPVQYVDPNGTSPGSNALAALEAVHPKKKPARAPFVKVSGSQNMRQSDFDGWTDKEVDDEHERVSRLPRPKDDKERKAQNNYKEKLKREQKARKTRNQEKNKEQHFEQEVPAYQPTYSPVPDYRDIGTTVLVGVGVGLIIIFFPETAPLVLPLAGKAFGG